MRRSEADDVAVLRNVPDWLASRAAQTPSAMVPAPKVANSSESDEARGQEVSRIGVATPGDGGVHAS